MFRQSKLALQGDVEGFSGRGVELKLVERGELLGAEVGQAAGGALAGEVHRVKLDVASELEGPFRRVAAARARGLELHAHDPVQDTPGRLIFLLLPLPDAHYLDQPRIRRSRQGGRVSPAGGYLGYLASSSAAILVERRCALCASRAWGDQLGA